MARIKRVGGHHAPSVQKEGKKFLWSKKFWIICSSILAALIVAGVTIGLVIYFMNKKNEESIDYFRKTDAVEFQYASYDGIANYANPEFNDPQTGKNIKKDHIFVLVYDSSNFYPSKSDDETNYNEEDENLLTRMIDLQKAVNEAKNSGKDVELYIVDTKYSWNVNAYTQKLFGGLYSDDSSSFSPMLVYIENGEYKESYNKYDYDDTEKDEELYISSNSTESNGLTEAYINNTLFNRITVFIKDYMGKEK